MSFVSSSSSRSGGGGSYGPRRDSVSQLLSRAKPVKRGITRALALFALALPALLVLVWLFGISINAPSANLAVVQPPPDGAPERADEERQGSTLLTIDAVAPQPWEAGTVGPLPRGMWGNDKTWVYVRRRGPLGDKLPFALLGHVPQRVLLPEGSYEIDVVYAPTFCIDAGSTYGFGAHYSDLPLVSKRVSLDVKGRRQTEQVMLSHFYDKIRGVQPAEASGLPDFLAAIASARIRPSVAADEVIADLPNLAETAVSESGEKAAIRDWAAFTRPPRVYTVAHLNSIKDWLYRASSHDANFGAAEHHIETLTTAAQWRPGLWTWLGVAIAGLILGRSVVITMLERDFDLWWFHALLTLLAAAATAWLVWSIVPWFL